MNAWQEKTKAIGCQCRYSDAWRCAGDRRLTTVACSCACHRYITDCWGSTMSEAALLDFFQNLDYTGSLLEVLKRVPDSMLNEFSSLVDREEDGTPALYFGLRRYAAERHVLELEDVNEEKGLAVMNTARLVLMMAGMERNGFVEIVWPVSPFLNPRERVQIAMTPAGDQRHANLSRALRARHERRLKNLS